MYFSKWNKHLEVDKETQTARISERYLNGFLTAWLETQHHIKENYSKDSTLNKRIFQVHKLSVSSIHHKAINKKKKKWISLHNKSTFLPHS